MKPFDIFITYLSWRGGGRNRPVMAYSIAESGVFVFRITTQYENKSETERSKYFKINDWAGAGLDKQYLDTGTLLKLPATVLRGKLPIGELLTADKRRLLRFLAE